MYQFPEDLKRAYESSPLSFVYYQNVDGRAVPVLVSDGFCRNTDMSRESVMDWLRIGLFERMHPNDVGVMVQISNDFLQHRGSYNIVFRCRVSSAVCVPKTEQKDVSELIRNEEHHYIEPRHGVSVTDKLWDLGSAVREHNFVEISYQRSKDKATVKRKIKPVALLFSEYYFYMAAYIDDEEVKKDFEEKDDPFPTIYRLDRIKDFKILPERFRVPYADRFEEGEFRNRIQFMFGGKLQKVRFKYKGYSVEAVLDRLPTAKIEEEKDGVYTISAEVFGKGIDMWLRSQGDFVEVLE